MVGIPLAMDDSDDADQTDVAQKSKFSSDGKHL